MKTLLFILGLGVIILLYGGLNFYIGLRGWQSLGRRIPHLSPRVYWPVFYLAVFSYVLARVVLEFVPNMVSRSLTFIGSFWLAAMVYFFLILVVIDLIRLVNRYTGIIPATLREKQWLAPLTGIVVLGAVAVIIVYGYFNARDAKVTSYAINIPKKAGELRKLHAVMVADIHLGTVVDSRWLERAVEMINRQKPDVVFLAGDMVDEKITPAEEPKLSAAFRRIKSKYGVYAVPGNHEYISGHAEEAIKKMESAGVVVLRDNYVKIADSFYVVGRDDRTGHRSFRDGASPQKLDAIMNGIDKSYPIIILDHEPTQLTEAIKAGGDLKLSGHTHAGQLWPGRLITSRIYEMDWGHLQKDSLHVIVTSGFGLWGPPLRTGNYPEIVDISITFK